MLKSMTRYARISFVGVLGLLTVVFFQNCSETRFSKRTSDSSINSSSVRSINIYDQTVLQGQRLDVIAVIGGDSAASPNFIWKKDGQMVAETSDAALIIESAELSDAGTYSVEYYDGFSLIGESEAQIAVIQQFFLPEITQQPVGVTVYAGQTINLTAAASGENLSYQWMQNGNAVSGQTSPSLSIPLATTAHAGQYWLVVSNEAGSVETNKVQVNVRTVFNRNVTVMTAPNPRDQYWGNQVNYSPTRSYNLAGAAETSNWKRITVEMTGYSTVFNRRANPIRMTLYKGKALSRNRVLRFSGANEREQTDYFRYNGADTITLRTRSRCTRSKCGSAWGGGAVSIRVLSIYY